MPSAECFGWVAMVCSTSAGTYLCRAFPTVASQARDMQKSSIARRKAVADITDEIEPWLRFIIGKRSWDVGYRYKEQAIVELFLRMLLCVAGYHETDEEAHSLHEELHLFSFIPDFVVPIIPSFVAKFISRNDSKKRETLMKLSRIQELAGQLDPCEVRKQARHEWHSRRASAIGSAKQQYVTLKKLHKQYSEAAFQRCLKALRVAATRVVSSHTDNHDTVLAFDLQKAMNTLKDVLTSQVAELHEDVEAVYNRDWTSQSTSTSTPAMRQRPSSLSSNPSWSESIASGDELLEDAAAEMTEVNDVDCVGEDASEDATDSCTSHDEARDEVEDSTGSESTDSESCGSTDDDERAPMAMACFQTNVVRCGPRLPTMDLDLVASGVQDD